MLQQALHSRNPGLWYFTRRARRLSGGSPGVAREPQNASSALLRARGAAQRSSSRASGPGLGRAPRGGRRRLRDPERLAPHVHSIGSASQELRRPHRRRLSREPVAAPIRAVARTVPRGRRRHLARLGPLVRAVPPVPEALDPRRRENRCARVRDGRRAGGPRARAPRAAGGPRGPARRRFER